MKRLLIPGFLFFLALAGCGQEQTDIDVSMTKEVWRGYVDEDQSLQQGFDTTMACLNKLGISHEGQPFVIIVDGWFKCNDNLTLGCYSPASQTIYLGNGGYALIFSHEVIHWGTRLGVDEHDSVYFVQCESGN